MWCASPNHSNEKPTKRLVDVVRRGTVGEGDVDTPASQGRCLCTHIHIYYIHIYTLLNKSGPNLPFPKKRRRRRQRANALDWVIYLYITNKHSTVYVNNSSWTRPINYPRTERIPLNIYTMNESWNWDSTGTGASIVVDWTTPPTIAPLLFGCFDRWFSVYASWTKSNLLIQHCKVLQEFRIRLIYSYG